MLPAAPAATGQSAAAAGRWHWHPHGHQGQQITSPLTPNALTISRKLPEPHYGKGPGQFILRNHASIQGVRLARKEGRVGAVHTPGHTYVRTVHGIDMVDTLPTRVVSLVDGIDSDVT